MTMSVQTWIVVAIVALALLFTTRRMLRALRSARASGRTMDAGCDCEASPARRGSDWAG